MGECVATNRLGRTLSLSFFLFTSLCYQNGYAVNLVTLSGPLDRRVVSDDESGPSGNTYEIRQGASLTVESNGSIGDIDSSLHRVINSMLFGKSGAFLYGNLQIYDKSVLNLGQGASPLATRVVVNAQGMNGVSVDSGSQANLDNVVISAAPSSRGRPASNPRSLVFIGSDSTMKTSRQTFLDGSLIGYGATVLGHNATLIVNGSNISGGRDALLVASHGKAEVFGATLFGGLFGVDAQSGGSLQIHGSRIEGGTNAEGRDDTAGVRLVSFPLSTPTTVVLDQGTRVIGYGRSSGIKLELEGGSAVAQILDSTVHSEGNGIEITSTTGSGVSGGSGEVLMEHATIASGREAITVGGNGVTAHILASKGTVLNAKNGTLLSTSGASRTYFTIDSSSVAGNIVANDTSTGTLRLQNGASLNGRIDGFDAHIESGSGWTLSGSSRVGDLGLNGTIIFAQQPSDTYKTLTVQNDLKGSGGVIALTTMLNAGGDLNHQATDRLLVQGNVMTTSPTILDIAPMGGGNDTAGTPRGQPKPDEGISVVQVAGLSRTDAFRLRYGYVARGPWQYTLVPFGARSPNGLPDERQSLLGKNKLSWDYRLLSRRVSSQLPDDGSTADGDENDGRADRTTSNERQSQRAAVVPQLPAYLSLQTAMTSYLLDSTGTLHERLGEVRRDALDLPGAYHAEGYARVFGANQDYRSDKSFSQYGTGFFNQYQGIQLGGNFYRNENADGSLRLGIAGIHANGNLAVNSADGASGASYQSTGIALMATWQLPSGVYVDAIMRGDRLLAEINTDAHGKIGTLNGWGWVSSVETGIPLPLARTVFVEPQAQLTLMGNSFNKFSDADHLQTQFEHKRTLVGRIGTRIGSDIYDGINHCTPFMQLDALFSSAGSSHILADDVPFEGGSYGQAWRVGAGLNIKLGDRTEVVARAAYQHRMGGSGFSGWNATGNFRRKF